MAGRRWQGVGWAVLALGAAGSGGCSETASPPSALASARESEAAHAPPLSARPAPTPPQAKAARATIDGHDFPDGVLALTWDDGPDAHTLELGRYLAKHHIAATFFVVGEWVRGVSEEPGRGDGVFETGYLHLPVLGELARLHHRIGNHTLNHAVLQQGLPSFVEQQLADNERAVEPFAGDEIHLFRAPGGYWNPRTTAAVAASPRLGDLTGPVGWDIDRKDWESSLYCRSAHPREECEREGPRHTLRVKAEVVARRYLESIEAVRHGVVLLHDRVGHVGSQYALAVARRIVPALEAKGYVFAAPVLHFSPLALRSRERPWSGGMSAAPVTIDPTTLRFGDVDGDGRQDVCARGSLGVVCSASEALGGGTSARAPLTVFGDAKPWDGALTDALGWSAPGAGDSAQLADVDGDGRADLCARAPTGITCALASRAGRFGALTSWSAPLDGTDDDAADFGDADGFAPSAGLRAIRFGDLDGDGKADVCGRAPEGIRCARSRGAGFEPAMVWTTAFADDGSFGAPVYGDSLELADVDGDGRDDICGRGPAGIVCALSRGDHFDPPTAWTRNGDFSDGDATPWAREASYWSTIRFADLNGDGRADVCGRGAAGVVCALSNGRGFLRATNWLREMSDEAGWAEAERATSIRLGDVNGDGRADLCGLGPDGLVCALSP